MWGSLTTNMFQTYVHLTGKDIDNETLRTYGITETKTGEGMSELRIEPRQCPHCKLINGPMDEFCNSCGRSLTELATEAEDDIHDSILKNMASLKRFIAKKALTSESSTGCSCFLAVESYPRIPHKAAATPSLRKVPKIFC